MKVTLLKNIALAVVGSFCVIGTADASPMSDGGLSMTDTYIPVNASYEPIGVKDATGIDFQPNFTGAVDNTFSFEMTSLTFGRQGVAGNTTILAYGSGLMRAAGYYDTPGVWNFTGQGVADADFSRSASAGTAPVTEPATMLLFGTGLIGLAGISARRRKKQIQAM